jgi:cytochrome c oxidase subunit 2
MGGSVPPAPAGSAHNRPSEACNVRKKVVLVLGLLALALLFAACAPNASQDSLNPAGPYAEAPKNLFEKVFWFGAVPVFVLVEGGIVWILIKYRHRKGQDRMPPQIHGNTRLEIGWTILPAVVLAVVMVPTVATIWDLAKAPPADALNVTVTGYQWWWEFEYTDPDMQTVAERPGPITTANELVIPTDRVVYLTVVSGVGGIEDAAVIHSFWIPELAGAQDAIPNQENHILMQADASGTYEGQCKEFCGLSHGIMKAQVRAVTPAEFDAWAAGQKEDAIAPTSGAAASGFDTFNGQCAACHGIQGTPAQGIAAPDLTHLMSRGCMVGCMLDPNDPEDLAMWLRDPPAFKPGSFMPDYDLSEAQIDELVVYLQTLE